MDCLIQGHEIEGLKKENVRLLSENGELRKMVALMQENVELRYALRDHETQVRTLSPPPACAIIKEHVSKKIITPCIKDIHAKGPPAAPGHGTCRSGITPSCQGAGNPCHGGSGMGMPCHGGVPSSRKDVSPGIGCHGSIQSSRKDVSPTSSLESHADQHMPGHRKLLESLTKFNSQDAAQKDQGKCIHMQRMMADYR
ncbi:uncharacterized protein O3C94_007478 isoform 2-T2 [Discoglossus pictus]